MPARKAGIAGMAMALCLPAWVSAAGTPLGSAPDRTIRRLDLPDSIRLSYEWADASGRRWAIDLPISRGDLETSEQALGFSLTELRAFLIDAEAQIRREQGLSPADIARTVVSRISNAELCRVGEDPKDEFNVVLRTNASQLPGGQAEVDRVLAAYRRRWEASRKAVCERLQARLKEYAGAHGMEVTPGGIAVDYRRLVRSSADRLKPLADEFRRICGRSKADLLAAVHSFVQSIPYEQGPPARDGRYTAGVDVPLKVLAEDRGDCDSKAVLFAAIWLDLSNARTILIQVPEHMLIGIALPFQEGTSITIQSVRYLLLEMSCAAKTPPGVISLYSAESLASRDYRFKIVS
jgi:hypothetical protein